MCFCMGDATTVQFALILIGRVDTEMGSRKEKSDKYFSLCSSLD